MRLQVIALAGLLALSACGPTEPQQAPEAPAAAPAEPPPQEPASAPDPTPTGHGPADDIARVEARFTPAYRQCLDGGEAAQGVTPAMAACIGAELALQDGALNAEYRRVQQSMPPSEFEAVRAAQREWIKARDARCAAEASSGGTIDRLNGPACLLEQTVRRTMSLEEIAAEGGR